MLRIDPPSLMPRRRHEQVTFELIINGPMLTDNADFTKAASDAEQVDNIIACIMDGLGYPENVIITAKVITRQFSMPVINKET